MDVADRLGQRLQGKGRPILYGIGALLAVGLVVWLFLWWQGRKADEAERALGHAIEISQASVSASPQPNSQELTFPTERDRAEHALAEFQKVSAQYGNPYRSIAQYFEATNLLVLDRDKGIAALENLRKSGNKEVAPMATFALAEAKEADGTFDDAAALYKELATNSNGLITPETANLRLAAVYEKQDKKKEASDLLFNIIDASRKARDKDGKPVRPSQAVSDADQALQRIDPDRYAQLPPAPPPTSSLDF